MISRTPNAVLGKKPTQDRRRPRCSLGTGRSQENHLENPERGIGSSQLLPEQDKRRPRDVLIGKSCSSCTQCALMKGRQLPYLDRGWFEYATPMKRISISSRSYVLTKIWRV